MKKIISSKLKSYSFYAAKKSVIAAGVIWMLLVVIGNAYPQFAGTPAFLRMAPASINPGGFGFLISMLGTGDMTNIPILSSIQPAFATVGGPAFVLTAHGSNFTTSSTIHWIGNILPTTYVSASQLQANIPAGYIAEAGTASVTVWTGDLSAPSGRPFTIGDPSKTPPLRVDSILGSISPSSASPGGPGFVLTASGTNFTNASVVQWNGSSRTTTYLNPRQLRAEILASDIAAPGVATVTVLTGDRITNPGQVFAIGDSSAPLRPRILGSNHSGVYAGAPEFLLTVTGTNFTSASVVQWNGSSRATIFVDPRTLQAKILASDIAAPGEAHISVYTPDAGVTNILPFTILLGPLW
jgi:trimeric autotransporter adhesin